MITRALIGIKQKDGSVLAIYLQHDGYPAGAGVILGGWYNTKEKIEELLSLGELISIDTTPETCVAYHRDLGEELNQASQYGDTREFIRKGFSYWDAEFCYLFDPGIDRWMVASKSEGYEFFELEVKGANK